MNIKDLVPRLRGEKAPARRTVEDGMLSFQREFNRMFDDFLSDFGLMPRMGTFVERAGGFMPRVDVEETDKEVRINAELPGMDEKDVSVELDEQAVTISGERRDESEEKGRNWRRVEQTYGSFHRVIPLPCRVDGAKAKAKFRKGVLKVELPKLPEEVRAGRTITIESD